MPQSSSSEFRAQLITKSCHPSPLRPLAALPCHLPCPHLFLFTPTSTYPPLSSPDLPFHPWASPLFFSSCPLPSNSIYHLPHLPSGLSFTLKKISHLSVSLLDSHVSSCLFLNSVRWEGEEKTGGWQGPRFEEQR